MWLVTKIYFRRDWFSNLKYKLLKIQYQVGPCLSFHFREELSLHVVKLYVRIGLFRRVDKHTFGHCEFRKSNSKYS